MATMNVIKVQWVVPGIKLCICAIQAAVHSTAAPLGTGIINTNNANRSKSVVLLHVIFAPTKLVAKTTILAISMHQACVHSSAYRMANAAAAAEYNVAQAQSAILTKH